VSRESLITHWGFVADPFATYSAELETNTAQLFIPPPYFHDVIGNPQRPNSAIVFGARGEGKSTLFEMVGKELRERKDKPPLVIGYTDFSDLSEKAIEQAELSFHVENILRRAIPKLLEHLEQNPSRLGRLDPTALSDLHWFILWLFSPDPARVEVKFLHLKDSAFPRGRLASAASKFGGGLYRYLRRRRFDLEHTPDAESATVQIAKAFVLFFPDTPGSRELRHESTVERLSRFVRVLHGLDFSSLIVLIDRVDESPAATRRPELATRLVEPLLSSLPLLELTGFAIKFFLPLIVREQLGRDLRIDRIRTRSISWTNETLEALLSRRLATFSDRRVTSLNALLAPENAAHIRRELMIYSAQRPRNMLRLLDHVVSELCEADEHPNVITIAAFEMGLTQFRAERLRDYDAADYEERVQAERERQADGN
jgi:hypothetical protein